MAKRSFHMTATKIFLIREVQFKGAESVFEGWEGSDEEAIAYLRADPYTEYPLGDCNNRSETGRCLGHPASGTTGNAKGK